MDCPNIKNQINRIVIIIFLQKKYYILFSFNILANGTENAASYPELTKVVCTAVTKAYWQQLVSDHQVEER